MAVDPDGPVFARAVEAVLRLPQRGSWLRPDPLVRARRQRPQLLTYPIPAPASATSTGTPGLVGFDAEGNWYRCYAQNFVRAHRSDRLWQRGGNPRLSW